MGGALGTTPMRGRLTAQVTRADTGEVEYHELTDWSEVPDEVKQEFSKKPSFMEWFRAERTKRTKRRGGK